MLTEITPLHLAAYNGHMEAINTLVELSADIEAKTANEATPLHWAASEGHVEAIKTLVELSADIEAKTANGATPLHLAAVVGDVEAVKTLLQLGAQMRARTDDGETALVLSVRLGHHGVAQVLRHFKRPARTRGKARRGAQPTTREDTPEAREAAERMAALLMEEEEENLEKAADTATQEVSGGRAIHVVHASTSERLPTQRARGVS